MVGTRLTPQRETELYGTVLDLLREVGYDALTMDAIATRTRSSKATLYRQWGSKPVLVARAIRCNKPDASQVADTGSLRGDLHAMAALADDARMQRDVALMRGLFHAVHGNPDLHEALREVMVEPDANGLQVLLDRAVVRGEIAVDHPALPFVPHMLVGAFVARQLIDDRSVDRAFLVAFLDAVVLPALGV
ncbi:TetR/AcrR family transcriptional regulator [Streptomyces liangshanensis]|uniref:TetR/AcrR family transcriptional regulator n=1 Tax=Streptomyces liangshanensis TaxID=2717324 RepID=A0A6G9H1I2_9ACTN|nr:TetR/AcrR family transcriptional regulator [Streptomyces liangshanensis]QIQ04365.1 TetR/AcrR family transcriptional regulator [Streptomyces liangshanensis]